jgi:dipeptidyl aminopeptidase/acylaminoacyl peptidase
LGHPIIDFHTGHVYESSNPPQGLNYSTSNDAFIAATDMEVAVSQRSFRVDSRVALYSVSGRPTRLLRSSRRFSFSAPIASPDGTRIAYQKTAYMIYGRGSSLTSSNSSLWVGPIDGCCDSRVLSNLRPWFVGGAPAWSPDGRFIASACAVPNNNHTLCIVDLTKHKFITPVSDLGSPSYPSWDPRGLKLAFIAARGGSSPDQEIYTYDLRSHRTTRLTDDAFGKTGLAWSPSGREIAYIGAGGVRLIPATRPNTMLGLLIRGDFNAVQWIQPSIAQ